MARKNYTAEQIIGMLREAEVRLSQGEKIGAICRALSVSEQSYYRWRRACRVVGQHRSTQRKPCQLRSDEKHLTADIIRLASTYGLYGSRRITALL